MIEWIIITSSLLILTTILWIVYFVSEDEVSKNKWRTYSIGCSVIVFIIIQLIYNISIFKCSSK